MHIPPIPFLEKPVPLCTFLLLAIAGMCAGHLAKRIKIPDISGQVVAGMLLGPGILGVFSANTLHEMKLITEVTLGVIAFIAGTHLSFKKLHNASRRVFLFSGADMVITFMGVFGMLSLLSILDVSGRLLLAAIAIATAPGTVVGIIQAKKASGVLVKTVIGVVALNNIAGIVAFVRTGEAARPYLLCTVTP
jgi:Kef-type K+ transport system membrane component KefB